MKCAVLISGDEKNIFLTPENDTEAEALKYITPQDDIQMEIYWGTFTDKEDVWRRQVSQCRGGWLRTFSHDKSLVLTLRPKVKKKSDDQ